MSQRLKRTPTPAWRQRGKHTKHTKRASGRRVTRTGSARAGGRRLWWVVGAVAVVVLIALLVAV